MIRRKYSEAWKEGGKRFRKDRRRKKRKQIEEAWSGEESESKGKGAH